MRLNEKEYARLYEKLEELKQKSGVTKPISLFAEKNRYMNGVATQVGNILLSEPLLELYGTDKENVIYYMMAHELVHIKFNDSNFNLLVWNLMWFLRNKRANALIMLMEMRASVIGNRLLGVQDKEIEEVQMYLQAFNKNFTGKASYKQGYPDRYQIIDFSVRYQSFSDELMEELLTDFCNVMEVKDNRFVKDVMTTFKEKCLYKCS